MKRTRNAFDKKMKKKTFLFDEHKWEFRRAEIFLFNCGPRSNYKQKGQGSYYPDDIEVNILLFCFQIEE